MGVLRIRLAASFGPHSRLTIFERCACDEVPTTVAAPKPNSIDHQARIF
jgi:hypothetical protein